VRKFSEISEINELTTETQRHREEKKLAVGSVQLAVILSAFSLSIFSLCLCVSVVNVLCKLEYEN
jgi:hypothetical protein